MPRDDIEGVLKLIMPADTFKENRRRSEQCTSFVEKMLRMYANMMG
jgi:hypothetical protein